MRSYRNSEPVPPIMKGTPPPPKWRIPRIDWDRPPWNRWAFQNISQILPTAPVRKGAAVSALPEAHADIGEVTFETAAGGAATVAEMIDATYTDGLLIMLDGKVVHESYHNGMDRRTPHLAQSVSKSITATAGAALIADGLIDPQAPVTAYLPELEATAWRGAKVQHVLDMASGVRFDESAYEDRESDVGKMDYAAGWKPAPAGIDAADWPTCVWDQILSLTTQEAEHGARFEYRSIETDVFAHVMERVTGQRLPEIISERLWAPIGAEEDALITVDAAGYGLSCGGFNACLRDFARFGLALLNDGQVEGRQAIPKAWIDDIRRGEHGLFSDIGREHLPKGSYRNQFWIEDAAKEASLCLGVFGQHIYVAPERGLAAVKLSTQPDFIDRNMLTDALAAFKAVADAFGA